MGHWQSRGAIAWLLWPASLLYGIVAVLRRTLYRLRLLRSHAAGIPVIVVGNLSAGGSGKTPLVMHVANLLREHGWRPGIVSRGYRPGARDADAAPMQATIASDPARVGDEPMLLARRTGCPVWVAPDRVAACRALRAQHPEVDVIVSDDGLQHYALRRDLEICVVDGRRFGNGFLLPAGPLREPPRRLASVSAVVAHDAPGIAGYRMSLEGNEVVRLGDAGSVRTLKSFSGERVHALAGIGDPARFFAQLERAGLRVERHPFPDHHAYRAEDLAFADGGTVLTTEKDAVKLRRIAQALPRAALWVFPVSAAVDPAFDRWLLERLGGLKAA